MKNLVMGGIAALIIVLLPFAASAADRAPCLEAEVCGTAEPYLDASERPRPLGSIEADPLGLLWDDGLPFDEDGTLVT